MGHKESNQTKQTKTLAKISEFTVISDPTVCLSRVATVRENILENKKKIPGQGKVREFHFQSGKSRKNEKVMEKSGNFKVFQKRC